MSPALRRWGWLLCVALAAQGPLCGQVGKGKEDDEVQKTPVDPYTGGDQEKLQALGHVHYGPFVWNRTSRTEDIDRVLGEGRVLWLETEHFRIGSNLRTVALPEKQAQKKALFAECAALRKLVGKFPDKPKRLDPWLRLHLYAQRIEALYDEMEAMLGERANFRGGAQAPDGKYLGLPDKFLLLLFQKKSDMARYFDRFCGGVKVDKSFGHYFIDSQQFVYGVSVEGLELADDDALHSHVLYGLCGNLINGLHGYSYQLPPWFVEGLAHAFSRRIETDFVNVSFQEGDHVDEQEQHKWAKKVRARAQYERTRIPFAQMQAWQRPDEMGYHGHLQAWSRMDFLMQQDKQKVGALWAALKSFPGGGSVPPEQLAQKTLAVLQQEFGLDAQGFDEAWAAWVLATYPRK